MDRKAIERMNQETEAQARARRLAAASRKVRKESMRVNAQFAAFEEDADPHCAKVLDLCR